MAGMRAGPTPGCQINNLNRCGSLIHLSSITDRKSIHPVISFPFRPGPRPASLSMTVPPTSWKHLPNAGVISPSGARRAASCVLSGRVSARPPALRNGFSRMAQVPAIILSTSASRPLTRPRQVPFIRFAMRANRIKSLSIRKFSQIFITSRMAGFTLANTASLERETNTSN